MVTTSVNNEMTIKFNAAVAKFEKFNSNAADRIYEMIGIGMDDSIFTTTINEFTTGYSNMLYTENIKILCNQL